MPLLTEIMFHSEQVISIVLVLANFCSCTNKFCLAELDALEADMETEGDGMPSYLQPAETDVEAELNLPAAPTRTSAVPAGASNAHVSCHPSY